MFSTFAQGFVLGQLSICLLLGAFIKFFIFGEAPSKSSPRTSKHIRTTSFHSLSSRNSPGNSLRKKPSNSNVLRAVPTSANDTASILRKTHYHVPNRSQGRINHSTHQPESLDWFNVLIAQTLAQYRQAVYALKDPSNDSPTVLSSLSNAINHKRPAFIGEIHIKEISLGEEYPIFSNVRVTALEDEDSNGRLQALVDVDISDDNLTLGIETALILNYPKPASAILPIELTVSLVRFSGTLSLSFVPAGETSSTVKEGVEYTGKPKTNLAFSFLPDYRLDLSVKSLIGSRSRLQDVPKVAQLVEARIQAWFEARVVEPMVQVAPLPGLWPKLAKTHVREGTEDDGRPVSKDGEGKLPAKSPRLVAAKSPAPVPLKSLGVKDNFPSQAEAERLVQGLKMRVPRQRSNSQAIIDDDVVLQTTSALPGALPA